jgi:hypothetical protein
MSNLSRSFEKAASWAREHQQLIAIAAGIAASALYVDRQMNKLRGDLDMERVKREKDLNTERIKRETSLEKEMVYREMLLLEESLKRTIEIEKMQKDIERLRTDLKNEVQKRFLRYGFRDDYTKLQKPGTVNYL